MSFLTNYVCTVYSLPKRFVYFFPQCGDTPSLDPPVSNEFSCKERPVTCVNDMQVPVNDSFCEAAEIPKPPSILK